MFSGSKNATMPFHVNHTASLVNGNSIVLISSP